MKNSPRISIIAAIGAINRVLGDGANIPWHISEDLKRFKELTLEHPVIMGRKTWESLPHKFRPLPGRTNIVITRNKDYEAEGAIVATSIEEALKEAALVEKHEIFVIGGGSIYRETLPLADKLYITLVEGEYEGGVFFPDYRGFGKETFREERATDDGLNYVFLEFEKEK